MYILPQYIKKSQQLLILQLVLAYITSSAFHDDFRDVYAQIQ